MTDWKVAVTDSFLNILYLATQLSDEVEQKKHLQGPWETFFAEVIHT